MNTSSSIFKNKVNCYRSRPARLSVRTKVAESTFIGTEQVPDGPPLRTLDDLPGEDIKIVVNSKPHPRLCFHARHIAHSS